MKHPPAPLRASRSHWPGEASSTAALEGRTPDAQVVGFVRPFIERALKDRVRYRYVQPTVQREGEGFRIEAPCCSRNVDADGGVIAIARLVPESDGRWTLFERDHLASVWVLHAPALSLVDALDRLCVDSERIFWP